MFTQRSKLVHTEIIALVQTNDIGRLNYVQLPKIASWKEIPLMSERHLIERIGCL